MGRGLGEKKGSGILSPGSQGPEAAGREEASRQEGPGRARCLARERTFVFF